MKHARAVVTVAALAVVLSSCGGSDDGGSSGKTDAAAPAPTTPAPPAAVGGGGGGGGSGPTKARYIAQADRICRAARAKLIPVQAKIVAASKGSDPAVVFRRYAALTGRAASVYSGALGQIQALDAPPADQAQVDRLEMLIAQIVDIMRQNSAAAAAQDTARLKSLNVEASGVASAYRSAAKAYGFRDCGRTVGALERRGNR
jgi:hypothetical protein